MDKSQLKEKPIKERKFQGNSVIRDTSGKIIPGRTRDLEEKKKGLAAKERLKVLLKENKNEFILRSYGVGKYGRCLGDIVLHHYDIEDVPTAQEVLIKEGHGKEYFGGKR